MWVHRDTKRIRKAKKLSEFKDKRKTDVEETEKLTRMMEDICELHHTLYEMTANADNAYKELLALIIKKSWFDRNVRDKLGEGAKHAGLILGGGAKTTGVVLSKFGDDAVQVAAAAGKVVGTTGLKVAGVFLAVGGVAVNVAEIGFTAHSIHKGSKNAKAEDMQQIMDLTDNHTKLIKEFYELLKRSDTEDRTRTTRSKASAGVVERLEVEIDNYKANNNKQAVKPSEDNEQERKQGDKQ